MDACRAARKSSWSLGVLALSSCLILTALPAWAVITRLLPLSVVLKEQPYICMAQVERLEPARQMMVLNVTEDLKGHFPYRRLTVHLKGDREAQKGQHLPQLLKRLAPGLPLVLFAQERGVQVTVFAYSNGTWFQMTGQRHAERNDTAVLAFTHCEPYLRRTFKGTTAELRALIREGLAGKRQLLPPDPQEPPGLGPELPAPSTPEGVEKQGPKSPSAALFRGAAGRPLLAVIPTLGIGGPLAILALLFPSLFGGVLLLCRRWGAFFSVLSLNSLLLLPGLLARGFGWVLPGTWWGDSRQLGLLMSGVTLLGVLWAWRRQLRLAAQGLPEAPRRTELLVLALLVLGGGLGLWFWGWDRGQWADPAWRLLLALTLAAGAGLIYVLLGRTLPAGVLRRPSTEGILLGAFLAAFLMFLGLHSARTVVSREVASETDAAVAVPQFHNHWLRMLAEGGGGSLYAAPCLDGRRAYVAVAHRQGLHTFGAVYCIDLESKKIVWKFDSEGRMKQVFSSPRLAEGRLYVGEGFHDDPDCNLYCLDAASGRLQWVFPTTSQTESSACVADGRVYFAAGNEGIYAVAAATGKKLWQYAGSGSRRLRVGATPVVAGGRLFVGSGVDRNHPDDPGETAVFCLEAASGRLLWKVPTDLPVWGEAVVAGEQVYVPLGNGDVLQDASQPAGAVLCLEAASGRLLWRCDLPNGVLCRPALDRDSLYVSARDGCCYCLNRFTGQRRWQTNLGSPLVTTPALDPPADPQTPALNVFVVAERGQVACLEARSGRRCWQWEGLVEQQPRLLSTPSLLLQPQAQGTRRLLFFGAGLSGDSLPALCCVEDFWPR
jgi:outer membrane protein assembly factor BamB